MTNVVRSVRLTQEEKEEVRDSVERELREAAQRQYRDQQHAVAKLQPVPEEEEENGEKVENYTRDVVPLQEMAPTKEDVEVYLKNGDRTNFNLEELDESLFFNSDSINYNFRIFREKDENNKNKIK